jgi:putative hydrolase of the HAD superfamily
VIEAVLFDALGTLVRLEPPWDRLRAVLRSRHGLEIAEQDAHRAMLAEMSYYRSHHREGRDQESLAELRRRCAGVLRSELPETADLGEDDLVEALLDAIRFSPYPDAAPALAVVRSLGLRAAVVSNWDCSLGAVLNELGLGGLLDAVVTSAKVGAAKPDPAIFDAALQEVQCRAENALFVGDSLETDIAGARRAGLRAVLVDRGAARADASEVETIASLEGLPELIPSTAG